MRVISSNIYDIDHDEKTLVLKVTFNNGSVYNYYDVPKEVADEFANAPSKGMYLRAVIKDAYRYEKV